MKRFFDFFSEVKQEIAVVNWISKKMAFQLMFLVSLFIFFFGVFFLGLDYLIINIVNLLNYL